MIKRYRGRSTRYDHLTVEELVKRDEKLQKKAREYELLRSGRQSAHPCGAQKDFAQERELSAEVVEGQGTAEGREL